MQNWCQTCGICASQKNPSPNSEQPWEQSRLVTLCKLLQWTYILGLFPDSDAGNSYTLVVGDYYTRWIEAYPIPNQEATTVATKLVDEFSVAFLF